VTSSPICGWDLETTIRTAGETSGGVVDVVVGAVSNGQCISCFY
jgi:hypothetical protein